MSESHAQHPALPDGAERGDGRVLTPIWSHPIVVCVQQAALAEAWIQELGHRRYTQTDYLAPATWEGLRRAIRVWIRYLETEAITDVPTAATVTGFRTWAARTRATSSVRHLLEAVHDLYRWAGRVGRYADIAATVPYLEVAPAPCLPPLSDADFRRSVDAVAGVDLRARRDRVILWTLWSCPIDTIALRRANIRAFDPAAATLVVADRWCISRAKRHGDDPTAVHLLLPEAVAALQAYLAMRPGVGPAAPLLANRQGKRLAVLTMRLAVLRALTAAGVRTSCATRQSYLGHYPRVTAADLDQLATRLPVDPKECARLRALAHLVAIPNAHIAWERLRLGDIDGVAGVIRGRRNSGSRVLSLTPAAHAALAAWIAHRAGAPASAPVFPDADGQAPSHHELKRALWAMFPERLPPMSTTTLWGSTSVLRRAVQAREIA